MKRRMKMPLLVLILAFLILSGCASSPVPLDNAEFAPKDRIYYQPIIQNPNTAKSIFVRDRGIQGNMVNAHIFINGIHAAAIDVGERVDFALEPGEYIFTVKPTDPFGMTVSDSLSQTLHAGKDHLYRVFFDGNAWRIQRVHPEIQNNP